MIRVADHPGVRIATPPFYFTAVTVSGALLVRPVALGERDGPGQSPVLTTGPSALRGGRLLPNRNECILGQVNGLVVAQLAGKLCKRAEP